MKILRKKNMQQNEELMYTPKLHWMYTSKHFFQILPFVIALCIFWSVCGSYWTWTACPLNLIFFPLFTIKHFLLGILVLSLIYFVCRIIQYLNIEYGITNKRLITKKGVCRMSVKEIPIDKIESITCIQSILGRLFRYGTVCINGIGGKTQQFYMVYRPYALRRKITEIIEKNKAITIIQGDLPKPDPVPVVEEEPIYRYGTFVRVLQETKK